MQCRLKSGLPRPNAVSPKTGAKWNACGEVCGWLRRLSQRGEVAEALEEIKTALPNPNRISHSAVVATRQAMDWLEALGRDRGARAALRGLLEAADRLDDRLPAIRRQLRRMARTIEVPAPALTIHAFGRGQVWVNGTQVTASEWQTQAVRELFFYFLAMNKPVSKEQVGSVLWPDTTEPARLRLRFKNEMYRLRRAVGQETILYEDEYYQLNPVADHEYDVEAFEAYLARAKTSSVTAEQIRLYQQAMDLAGGEYLEDFGAVWVAPERERLHQEFVSAGLRLGELYYAEGQSAAALKACQMDPGARTDIRICLPPEDEHPSAAGRQSRSRAHVPRLRGELAGRVRNAALGGNPGLIPQVGCLTGLPAPTGCRRSGDNSASSTLFFGACFGARGDLYSAHFRP